MAFDPVLLVIPQLENHSSTSLSVKTIIMSLSFAFFLGLHLLSYISLYSFLKAFGKLSGKDQWYWCHQIVLSVYAFPAVFAGFWYLFVDDTVRKDIVNASNYTTCFCAYITNGLSIYEVVSLFYTFIYHRYFKWDWFAHHFVLLVGFSLVVIYDKGHFFAAVGIIQEMVMPLALLGSLLYRGGMDHLWIWKASQFVNIHLFHCRTIVEVYAYYKFISQWDIVWANMPVPLIIVVVAHMNLALLYETPYWTYSKIMLFARVVNRYKTEKDVSKNDGEDEDVSRSSEEKHLKSA